jgi:hypothetical protein
MSEKRNHLINGMDTESIEEMKKMLIVHLESNFHPKIPKSSIEIIVNDFDKYWNQDIFIDDLEEKYGDEIYRDFSDFFYLEDVE